MEIRFRNHECCQDEAVNRKVRELALLHELDHPSASKQAGHESCDEPQRQGKRLPFGRKRLTGPPRIEHVFRNFSEDQRDNHQEREPGCLLTINAQ